jgi:hypothetical protein
MLAKSTFSEMQNKLAVQDALAMLLGENRIKTTLTDNHKILNPTNPALLDKANIKISPVVAQKSKKAGV